MLRALTTRLLPAGTLLWPCTASAAGPAAPGATNAPAADPGACPAQVVARERLVAASASLSGIAAVSATDIWATGSVSVTTALTGASVPLVEHFDGNAWCAVDPASPAGVAAGVGVSLSYLATNRHYPWNEQVWAALPAVPPPTGFALPALGSEAIAGADDIWQSGSVASSGLPVQRWYGRRWRALPLPPPTEIDVGSLSGGPMAMLSASQNRTPIHTAGAPLGPRASCSPLPTPAGKSAASVLAPCGLRSGFTLEGR